MPGLVSDQLIDNLRKVAYKQLVTPVTVHRPTKEEGEFGTKETDFVAFETMGWFIPAFKGSISRHAGNLAASNSGAEFRFRWDEDIQVGDHLEVNGQVGFIVQDVNSGATIQLYLKAWCERIE
jgi:hypothetical protein